MKHVRIEIIVTAIVHVGEGITEVTPKGIPFHADSIEFRRVVPLIQERSQADTVKAHVESMIESLSATLPERLAHGSKNL